MMTKKVLVVVLLAMLALVPACGDDDESIVGTWVTTMENGNKNELTLTASTYEMIAFNAEGVKVDGDKGTYTYSGTSLTLTETHSLNDNLEWVVSSDSEPTTLTCSISDGKMTITTGKGTFVFTKK